MNSNIIIAAIVAAALYFAYLAVAGILFAKAAEECKHEEEAKNWNFVLFAFVVCLAWPVTLPAAAVFSLFSKDGENEK